MRKFIVVVDSTFIIVEFVYVFEWTKFRRPIIYVKTLIACHLSHSALWVLCNPVTVLANGAAADLMAGMGDIDSVEVESHISNVPE